MDKSTIGTCSKCQGPVTLVTTRTPMYQCEQCGEKYGKDIVGEYGVVVGANSQRVADLEARLEGAKKFIEIIKAHYKIGSQKTPLLSGALEHTE